MKFKEGEVRPENTRARTQIGPNRVAEVLFKTREKA